MLRIIHLAGPPKAMGEAFGEAHRAEIQEFYRLRVLNALSQAAQYGGRKLGESHLLAVAGKSLSISESYDPAGFQELNGIARDQLILRMKPEDWDQTIGINLSSVFRLTKACLKRMLKERRGRIINISSVVGAIGNPGQVHYAAAKAGLVGFTKSLARELGSRGITVNAVAPGFIETDMTRSLTPEQRSAYASQIPLGRFGDAADVAHAVLFLASARAGYVTGQTLHVNGGMYMSGGG